MSWCGHCGKHTTECECPRPTGTDTPLCARGLPCIGQE